MTKKVEPLSLRKNFSWNFLGSLVFSFSQFILLVILAKLTNPEMVGLYSLGLAITTPIFLFTNLQLRQIQATDTDYYYKFSDYLGLRIISGIVAILITLLLIFVGGYDIYKSVIIILVALINLFDSYSDVVYGQLQQKERMDYIGKSRIIKGILSSVIIGITLFITKELHYALITLSVLSLLIFWKYDIQNVKLYVKDFKPAFNSKKLKRLVVFAFPLGIVLMLNSLNTNLPRILVDRYLGEESLGYFASISYLLIVGNTFIQSIGQAVAPRLAKLYSDKVYGEFKRTMFFLILIGIIIGTLTTLIAIFFGGPILTIIYDSSYADYNNIFIIIMLSGIFIYSSSLLGYGITSMRLFKIQPVIGIIGLIITILSSIVFIPTYGINGAAYTLIIGGIIQSLLKLIVIILNLREKKFSASIF